MTRELSRACWKHHVSVNTNYLYNIYTMWDQRLKNFADVVEMLYKCVKWNIVMASVIEKSGPELTESTFISYGTVHIIIYCCILDIELCSDQHVNCSWKLFTLVNPLTTRELNYFPPLWLVNSYLSLSSLDLVNYVQLLAYIPQNHCVHLVFY